MRNSISLPLSLLSSAYLCSNSIMLINQTLLHDKKIPLHLNIINGLTFVISGSIFTYISINLLIK